MAKQYNDSVIQLFKDAGWIEGRTVAVSPTVEQSLSLFALAHDVLAEFGNLHIGDCRPGIECARSDVKFDVSLTMFLWPELRPWEFKLKTRLFPLAEVHRAHGYLIMDSEGRIYLFSDTLEPFAPSFPQGIEQLLLGRMPRKSEITTAWGNSLDVPEE